MCTYLFLYLNKKIDENKLSRIAKTYSLVIETESDYANMTKIRFSNKYGLKNDPGFGFILQEDLNSSCSCSLMENIKAYAQNKIGNKSNFIDFIAELLIKHDIKSIYVIFWDGVKDVEMFLDIQVNLDLFNDIIVDHFSKETERFSEHWTPDIDRIFLVKN